MISWYNSNVKINKNICYNYTIYKIDFESSADLKTAHLLLYNQTRH